jgi:outer membrane protein OmpA-like peptidoglycan-associated protein
MEQTMKAKLGTGSNRSIALPAILTVSFFIYTSQSFAPTLSAQSKAPAQRRLDPRASKSATIAAMQRPGVQWLCWEPPFRFREDNLVEGHTNCLNQAADYLINQPGSSVVIDGHRDSSERVGISITRANLFRDYLVNKREIDASRIRVRNFSDTCPINLKETWRNSRVEVGFIPPGAEFDFNQTFRKCDSGSKPYVVTHESPSTSIELRTIKRGR